MKVVIVEDELPAAAYLVELLAEIDETIAVTHVLHSVESAVAFFKEVKDVDLVFMDVELPDGLSLKIFEQANLNAPVIFTTGHRDYALEAFKANGFDYILKPYTQEDIQTALQKVKNFSRYMNGSSLNMRSINKIESQYRKILVVKKGLEFALLKAECIVCLYSENFVVFAFDNEGRKLIVETDNLTSLQEELDPAIFFRANRKYIVNNQYLVSYKVVERVKLQLEMTITLREPIKVGQERAKEFRKWLRTV